MKKFIIPALCVLLAVLMGAFAYHYKNVYKPSIDETPDNSGVYVPDGLLTGERGVKTLIAESEEGGFKLYKEGDYVILQQGDFEKEFSDWSKNIGAEKPQMYFNDFNGDGENELVIRALKDISAETKEHVYCLYVVFPETKEDGTKDFGVAYVDRSSWFASFSQMVNAEMNQPDGAKNRLQFAMNSANKPIAYDSVTGIITEGHAWYARALTDTLGNYHTFAGWEKGEGIFNVDNENKEINVDITIFASYDGVKEKQNAGAIRCGLVVTKEKIALRSKSLLFVSSEQYMATDPAEVAAKDWECTFNNTSSSSKTEKVINRLSVSLDLSSVNKTKRVSMSSKKDDSSLIDRVEADNNEIRVYATKGNDFARTKTASRDYSAVITYRDVPCDVCFSAEIKNENGESVLVYTLDKSYSNEELDGVTLKFGM